MGLVLPRVELGLDPDPAVLAAAARRWLQRAGLCALAGGWSSPRPARLSAASCSCPWPVAARRNRHFQRLNLWNASQWAGELAHAGFEVELIRPYLSPGLVWAWDALEFIQMPRLRGKRLFGQAQLPGWTAGLPGWTCLRRRQAAGGCWWRENFFLNLCSTLYKLMRINYGRAMKLGISSWTYTWSIGVAGHPPARPFGLMDLLDRAAMFEVGVLQVADNLPLDGLAPAELEAFAARAEALGIEIEAGTRGIQPDHLRRYLGLARRLKSKILRVVIDTPNHHPAPREVVELLAPLRSEFEDAGVTLAIENHDRFTSPTLVSIIEKLQFGWVGVCLDTANSFAALEGTPQTVEILGPYCVNLHLKDFTIFRNNAMMGFIIEGRPVGQGRLDVPWLLGRLRAFGRDPNAVLEMWTPPEPALEDTIAKEQRWAELSIAFLQEAIKH